MSNPPQSLAAKMAAIMGDVPTMIKNGQNVQQKYLYVTAEDVKAALRPLFKKYNIAVFSSMVGVDRKEGTTKSGGASMTTVARMRFILMCGETGEKMECEWFGESTDYGDKSVNKAATAAEKYWLINTFLLSTTEPDADQETIEHAAPAQPSIITPDQFSAINALGNSLYGDEWKLTGRALVDRFTNGITNKPKEMTEMEAAALYQYLQEEHAKMSGGL